MHIIIKWFRSTLTSRRVVIHTIAGRITYRRPKGEDVDAYRSKVQGWLATDRKTQKFENIVVVTSEIVAVEIH